MGRVNRITESSSPTPAEHQSSRQRREPFYSRDLIKKPSTRPGQISMGILSSSSMRTNYLRYMPIFRKLMLRRIKKSSQHRKLAKSVGRVGQSAAISISKSARETVKIILRHKTLSYG